MTRIIIKQVFLAVKKQGAIIIISAKAKKETQNTIDFWTKKNVYELMKIDSIYNNIVYLELNVI